MTIVEFVLAIIGSNVVTAVVTAWLRRGQTRSEIHKDDVDSEHTSVETANDVMGMIKAAYEERVSNLENRLAAETARANANEKLVADLKKSLADTVQSQSDTMVRLVNTESRLAQSEARAADAEKRATEFRQDIIRVGTQIQEYRRLINELGEIMGGLISQLKKLGVEPGVSPEILTRIAEINSTYGANRTNAR